MASHAAAGNPRIRNNDPPTLTPKEGKRQASRSPAGGKQPAFKRPSQSLQPAPPAHGLPARPPSININDPRRSNADSPAGSRRNSVSTSTNGIDGNAGSSKQLNVNNGLDSSSGTVGSSDGSTPLTPITSVAVVSGAAPAQLANASPDLQTAILNALMGVSEQASELALGKLEAKQAHIALAKAQREYDAMEKQFAKYPAIEEQKTAARTSLQKRYDEAQKSFNQAQANQAQVVGTAAAAIVELLQQQGGIDPDIRADVQSARCRANECLERLATIEQKLTSLSTRVDDTRALLDRQRSNAPQPTMDQFAKLEARVNEASALQQSPSMMDPAELTELKNRVEAVERGQEDSVELVGAHANEKIAEVIEWAQTEIANLKANVDQANETQHANAQTINELLSSVETLRTSVDENAPHGPLSTGELLEALGQRLDMLALEVQKMQPAKPPSPPPAVVDPNDPLGLKKFKPVHNVEPEFQPPPEKPTIKVLEQRPAVGVKWDEWIENHIGALYGLTNVNTMRLNNVTTDEIHDAMMRAMREKYSKEYPDLLTWQKTVEEIKVTHTRDIGQLKAIHDQDVGQIRADANSLTLRVEAHDAVIAQGQQKVAEIHREYRAISQDVLELQGAQQKALERAVVDATA